MAEGVAREGDFVAKQPARKLAVILHADVVGSTELVQRNEALAHARIRDAFHRLSSAIEAYQGLTHELRGDALVAEFARASDALAAAFAFQVDNTASNARLDGDVRPEIRVGISIGEVVVADNTVTGAGVVLAQRIEQLALPGGVCITGAIHEAVPRHLPIVYIDLGKHAAKGFTVTVPPVIRAMRNVGFLCREPVHVQALVAKTAVERLDVRVVGRHAPTRPLTRITGWR